MKTLLPVSIVYSFLHSVCLHICCVCVCVRTEILLPSGVSQETVKTRRLPEDGCTPTPCTSSGRSWPQNKHKSSVTLKCSLIQYAMMNSQPPCSSLTLFCALSSSKALAVAGLSPLLRRSHSPTLFSRLCSTPPASPTGILHAVHTLKAWKSVCRVLALQFLCKHNYTFI